MRSRTRSRLLGSAVAALVLPLALAGMAPAHADTTVAAAYDFEDGTTQGWTARGGATVASSTMEAHSGGRSLRTTGRTQGWEGPSVDLTATLRASATYTISAYVRLVSGQAAAPVQMTMQRTPAGGATGYDFVAAATATDADWAHLSGSYTVPADSTQLQLYVESGDGAASYDVDDVTVTMTAGPPDGPPEQAGLTSDFEDGAAQGWASRSGTEQLAATTAEAHGGTHSLLTTGRTQSWMGPATACSA